MDNPGFYTLISSKKVLMFVKHRFEESLWRVRAVYVAAAF